MERGIRKYSPQNIYNINITDYKEITEQNTNIKYNQFIYDLNQDNDYNKDLCILSQVNNNHFNLLFHVSYKRLKNSGGKLLFLNRYSNINEIHINNNNNHKKENFKLSNINIIKYKNSTNHIEIYNKIENSNKNNKLIKILIIIKILFLKLTIEKIIYQLILKKKLKILKIMMNLTKN